MFRALIMAILLPLTAWSMGNPYSRLLEMDNEMHPQPTGINEDCSFKYRGGRQPLLGGMADATCMKIRHSTPIEISNDCSYLNYKPLLKDNLYGNSLVYRDRYARIQEEVYIGLQYASSAVKPMFKFREQVSQIPFGVLEYELLVGRYCQQSLPTSAQQAFNPHVDVPAHVINFWTEEYIHELWRPSLPSLKASNPELDYGVFMELNISGAQVWKKVLECSNGDAELARNSYRNAEFNCENGEAIRTLVKGYIQSVQSFFATAYFQAPKFKIQTQYELASAIRRHQEIKVNKYTSLPTLHPLFLQAIIQMQAEIYPAGTREKADPQFTLKKLGVMDESGNVITEGNLIYASVTQMDEMIPQGLPAYGLWPSANLAIHGHIAGVRMEFLKKLLPDAQIMTFNEITFGPLYKLPSVYAENKAKLVDEVRLINKRYGL